MTCMMSLSFVWLSPRRKCLRWSLLKQPRRQEPMRGCFLILQKSIACVTGKVKDVSKVAGEYHYYTLSMHMKDKMVSCPVMNAEGQVFGIAQKSSGIDTGDYLLCGGSSFCHVAENQCSFFGRRCLEKHWYPERFT